MALGKWVTCAAELWGGDWGVNRTAWTGPPHGKHVGGLEPGIPVSTAGHGTSTRFQACRTGGGATGGVRSKEEGAGGFHLLLPVLLDCVSTMNAGVAFGPGGQGGP